MNRIKPLGWGVTTFLAFVSNKAKGKRGNASVAVRGGIQSPPLEFIMQDAQLSKKLSRLRVFGSGEAETGMEGVRDPSYGAVMVD